LLTTIGSTPRSLRLQENHLDVYAIVGPVVGSLIVGLMARYGSELIRGHGIPGAIESILMNGSRVSPRLAGARSTRSCVVFRMMRSSDTGCG
jgi:CIC family chloride channel protein